MPMSSWNDLDTTQIRGFKKVVLFRFQQRFTKHAISQPKAMSRFFLYWGAILAKKIYDPEKLEGFGAMFLSSF